MKLFKRHKKEHVCSWVGPPIMAAPGSHPCKAGSPLERSVWLCRHHWYACSAKGCDKRKYEGYAYIRAEDWALRVMDLMGYDPLVQANFEEALDAYEANLVVAMNDALAAVQVTVNGMRAASEGCPADSEEDARLGGIGDAARWVQFALDNGDVYPGRGGEI